jgi:2-hydroxy-6-oxonona-2,4-dienedioate hydrolase
VRCRGLILVDGTRSLEMPALLRAAGAFAPTRRLLRALYLKTVFNPAVLPRAYADPARAPAELSRVLAHPPPAQVDLILGVLLAGAREAASDRPTLVVWGESDRLPGTGPETGRKVQRSIPGAQLVLIPSAGHCPQMERPEEFVRAVEAFVASASPAGRHLD